MTKQRASDEQRDEEMREYDEKAQDQDNSIKKLKSVNEKFVFLFSSKFFLIFIFFIEIYFRLAAENISLKESLSFVNVHRSDSICERDRYISLFLDI